MTKAVSVSVKDVTWSLPLNRKKILHPISFDLDPGKILGVVGPNGSGKSTLLRLLYRFYKPTSGWIKIDETNIWAVSNKEVARKVAVVLQEQPSDFALMYLILYHLDEHHIVVGVVVPMEIMIIKS